MRSTVFLAALLVIAIAPAAAAQSPGPDATIVIPPDLRDAVAGAADDEAMLPLDPDGDATCEPSAIELTFEPVPEGAFAAGGYAQPLVAPGEADDGGVTGIAVCADSEHAVAGFDAFPDGEGWIVYFIAPLQDDGDESHGSSSLQKEDGASAPSFSRQAASGQVRSAPEWPAGLPRVAEPLAAYDPQDTCDPTAQRGTRALRDLIEASYHTNSGFGIVRSCNIGGTSEHKEGRALDWMINATDPDERALGDGFTRWLLGSDPWGNAHAGMRRLGIMYMIWNRRIISSYNIDAGWRNYTGSSPHTDHVHFSMSWDGARCQTSFWQATNCTGDVGNSVEPALDTSRVSASVRGDFDGDGHSDVLWYRPGGARDGMWFGSDDDFVKGLSTSVKGTYTPLVGDFDGDGHDDILWYGAGRSSDGRWNGTARRGVFDKGLPLEVNGDYRPVIGDFDGDGYDDVFWYGPGADADGLWLGTRGGGFRRDGSVNVDGTYRPVAGDFDGDGYDDVLWYGPGNNRDGLWLGGAKGTFAPAGRQTLTMAAEPLTGDFDGDGYDDVFFYAPGSVEDVVVRGGPGAVFVADTKTPISGTYRPFAGDFDDDGHSDIFWYGPADSDDWVYYGRSDGFAPISSSVSGDYRPIAGG